MLAAAVLDDDDDSSSSQRQPRTIDSLFVLLDQNSRPMRLLSGQLSKPSDTTAGGECDDCQQASYTEIVLMLAIPVRCPHRHDTRSS